MHIKRKLSYKFQNQMQNLSLKTKKSTPASNKAP